MKADPKNKDEIELEHFKKMQKAKRSFYLRRINTAETWKEGNYLILAVSGYLAEMMHDLYSAKRAGYYRPQTSIVLIKRGIF